MQKYYMVGNTHFDPVWLWTWDEAMASIRATFRSALDRMKEDPGFIYSFATPPVFEWIKKVDPDMFEEIRQRVKEGRWDLAEAWWLQPDCYSAMGESYVRQGLYGQKYLRENFGQISDCVFNIDSFGHSPMLPQILKKSHVDKYCFVRPEKRFVTLEKPLFCWKGLDGTQVLAFRAEGVYEAHLSDAIQRQTEKQDDVMIVYGVTDHGGAPTKEAIREINANAQAEFSTVSRYFQEHADCSYVVDQELTTGDFGPYSNDPQIKKWNRVAEYAVLNAEKASLIAGNYDRKTLEKCWQDVMFNQFHDIIGGCCIPEAYFDAKCMQGRAIQTAKEITHYNLQSVTRRIKMLGRNPVDVWNIVVWNLNTSDFEGYVEAEVQWAHEFGWYNKGLELQDAEGNVIPCQLITAKAVLSGFRSRFVFKAEVPATGYKVYKLVKTGLEETKCTVDPFMLESDHLKIVISPETGAVQGIYDRVTGEKLCGPLLQPVCHRDDSNTWCFETAGYAEAAEPFEMTDARVIEAGKLRTVVKIAYRFRESKLEMFYTAYKNESYVDVSYRVNWNEQHYVFKLETLADGDAHIASIPYGSIRRGASARDLPFSGWLRCGDLTLIADGCYAYSMVDKTLGLTVLRSPIYGDLRVGEMDDGEEHPFLSQGITEGKVRVRFDGAAWEEVNAFLNPPVVIDECNHDGDLPAERGYYRVEGEGVLLSAVKKCEFDDSEIYRLFEYEGRDKLVQLHTPSGNYAVALNAWEIKTLKNENGILTEVYMTEDEVC